MPNYADTTRYQLQYPLSTAPTNVPGDIENPLASLDSLLTPTYVGTIGARPSAGIYTTPSATGQTGRRYYATNGGGPGVGTISFDTGSAWVNEGPINTTPGNISSSNPADTGSAGVNPLSAAADHRHARESWGASADYKPTGVGNSGALPRVARSDHVHPGLAVGVPIPWPGSTIPSGYLKLDGRVVVQATYPVLYSYYGTTWNTGGEGAGNFRLPNWVDRTPVGAGNLFTLGEYAGAATTTLNGSQLPTHSHGINDPGHAHFVSDGGHHHGTNTPDDFIYGSSPNSTIYTNSGANIDHSPAWNLGAVGQTQNVATGVTVLNSGTGVTVQASGAGSGVSLIQPVAGVYWITLAG